MRIALICLPHYLHTKRLVLRQLGELSDHEFYVLEDSGPEGGFAGLSVSPNVHLVPVASLDEGLLSELVLQLKVEQVISFSDRGLLLASQLRERYGIRGNSVITENWVVDKGAMREQLNKAGLSKIAYRRTSLSGLAEDSVDFSLPLIVKPIGMSGSLCVELIDSREALNGYIARCRANKVLRSDKLLIEEYMSGKEFSVEGFVVHGKPTFFGVTESHTSGAPYFVGSGHDFFARHPDVERIEVFVRQVLHCLEFVNCPFHIEVKYVDHGYEIVEVHSRYGGAMIMELVESATGAQPFANYVTLLAGGSIVPARVASGKAIYSQHLLCVGEGLITHMRLTLDLSAHDRVISYALDFKDGDLIERNILPVNYLGYVTYSAESLDDANDFRKLIDSHLTIELE